MQPLLSTEQVNHVMEVITNPPLCRVINAPTMTVDRWGDRFFIFEGWGDVRLVRDTVCELYPEQAAEVSRLAGDYPQLEYMIGEIGFSDQYQTCDHCQTAIQTDDPNPYYHYDSDQGYFLCGDCLKNNHDFADDYLSYMAYHLEDSGDCIYTHFADPSAFGFVCLNNRNRYCREDHPRNHPDYISSLDYASCDDLRRLGKAARLIDPSLQIVYSYEHTYSGSVILWARFNPNESRDWAYLANGDGDWAKQVDWDWQPDPTTEPEGMILGYAVSRMFAKYAKLTR